jgi:hypothetical protein
VIRLALLFLILLSTGCGDADRATVTGTLTRHDGTPLAGARVVARSNETGKASYARTDEQGRFALGGEQEGDGIPPGEYYVLIVENRGEGANRRPPSISLKYRDPSASRLTFKVDPGGQTELNLKLDPPSPKSG